MRKLLMTLAGAGLVLGTAIPAASAQPYGYYGQGSYYGGPGPYYGGYRHHRRHFDGGDALVGGAIGLGVGALLGSALAAPPPPPPPTYYYPSRPVYVEPPSYRDTIPARSYYGGPRGHVEACFARYRSYDPRSDTFLGYDGYRHPCDL